MKPRVTARPSEERRRLGGLHEEARADDRADAERDERRRAESVRFSPFSWSAASVRRCERGLRRKRFAIGKRGNTTGARALGRRDARPYRSHMRKLAVAAAALVSAGACDAKPSPSAQTSGAAAPLEAALPAASSAASVSPPDAAAPPRAELWEGKLKVGGGMELRLVLHVQEADGGALEAKLDSPDQGATGLDVATISVAGGTMRFSLPKLKAEYEGKIADGGAEVSGDFVQLGQKLPLTLRKVEHATEVARPQTPKPPFPYREDQVTYENPAGHITLAGTLTVPQGAGPFPGVILITGSGAQDRDETLFSHKPFMVIADYLTRRGVAVLRVDDRGVGGSTGSVEESTTADFAGDVLAGVAFLKTRKEINPARIGLIGHSEGGEIAPLAATQSKDVAFIVLLAGPGLPGADIMLLQSELISKVSGAPEADTKRALRAMKRGLDVVKAEKQAKTEVLEAKLAAVAKEEAQALGPEMDAEKARVLVKKLSTPWFRFFVTYDPRPSLTKVRCPVLALSGSKDLQVPPKENLAELKKAFAAGANTHVTLKELPGLNHLFQTAEKGLPDEYARIEETFAPAALAAMGDWIAEQTRQNAPAIK